MVSQFSFAFNKSQTDECRFEANKPFSEQARGDKTN